MAGDWAEYQMGQRQIQENQMPSQAYWSIAATTPHAGIPSRYMYQNVYFSPQDVFDLKHPNRSWLDSVVRRTCAKGQELYA